MASHKVHDPDVVAEIQRMKEEVIERINATNEKIDLSNLRLSTIEAIEALGQSEVILTQLRGAVGESDIRARIMMATPEPIKSSELQALLGLSRQHLANETRPLRDCNLLYKYEEQREVYYRWAGSLRLLPRKAVTTIIRAQVRK